MRRVAVSRRWLIGAALAPALAAACGRSDDLDTVPKTGTSEGKVVYATWGTPERRELENTSLLVFEKNYTDLKVDVVWSATIADYLAKQASLISSGAAPDVVRLPSWSAPTYYYEEKVERLDPYFRRDGFKTEYLAPPFDVATFKRSWYALPRGVCGTWVVFYNRELFDRAGLNAPASSWTWDDFLNAARALTRGDSAGGTQWGTAIEPMVDFYYPWLWGNGADEIDRTGTSSTIDQDTARAALQWIADLRHKHKVAPPEGEIQDNLAAFAGGRLGMWFGPADAELDFGRMKAPDYAIAPQPKGKTQQQAGYKPDVIALTALGQHPDDGWELMQFLVDAANQQFEFQNGLWLPQAKSLTGSEAYQKPSGPPHDRRPGIASIGPHARTPVMSPRIDEMRAATQKELAPFWKGSRNVTDATTAAAAAVNAILNGAS